MTNRQRLNMHVTNPACVSCHRLIDPIGFGFEQYDAIGRFREKHVLTIFPTRDEKMKGLKKKETKYELPLDISAEVAGIADSSFSSPRELGEILGGNAVCQKCVVKQLFRYAMGRAETTADRETIERSFERFRDSQFRFRELIISIVTSKPFLGHWRLSMPSNTTLSRRRLLQGLGVAGAAVRVGLPALECMFNPSGTAYAAANRLASKEIESRFVLWFNGNGIIERFWIPRGDRPRLPHHALPHADRSLSQRRSRHHGARQSGRAAAGAGQRPPPLDERANVGYVVQRSRRGADRRSTR